MGLSIQPHRYQRPECLSQGRENPFSVFLFSLFSVSVCVPLFVYVMFTHESVERRERREAWSSLGWYSLGMLHVVFWNGIWDLQLTEQARLTGHRLCLSPVLHPSDCKNMPPQTVLNSGARNQNQVPHTSPAELPALSSHLFIWAPLLLLFLTFCICFLYTA